MIRIYHTIGDTAPLRLRLYRNKVPTDLTGYTITLTVKRIYKTAPIVINAVPVVIDANQVTNRGWVQYNWQPADVNIPAGVYEAHLSANNGFEIKTYPTSDNDDDFIVIHMQNA